MKYVLVCCQYPTVGLLDKPGRWVRTVYYNYITEVPDVEKFIITDKALVVSEAP